MAGIFIVLEGIDGSGKSELAKRLFAFLYDRSKRYDEIVVTREPTYRHHGAEIRRILREENDAFSNAKRMAELYVSDRKEHVQQVILPAMQRDAVVICDRYMMSTVAFQSTQGMDVDELVEMHSGLPFPHITLLLDVEPETAFQRIRGNKEKFEQLEFMKKLRQQYLLLAEKLASQNTVILDANASMEGVFSQAVQVLEGKKILPY